MRLADMHIHTTFSPDGKSSMEEQCIKAIEIGIPIICFTDHVDFNSSEINVGRIINKASTNFDVSEYFYEVNRLRRIYNSIQILIGIEFSEPHLFPTEFEDYSSMPFDYILGSIHHCYGSVFPGAKNIEESKAIDEYFPAVIHRADYTTRPQTVSCKTNPLYYDAIKHFYEITGCPLVLNTSFNDKGQPIIMSPELAVDFIKKNPVDVLAIGNYLVINK